MKVRLAIPIAALLFTAGAASLCVGAPAEKAKCIVSGKEIEVGEKTPKVYVQGKAAYFCCPNCPKAFAKTPEKFVKEAGKCPVMENTPVTAPAANLRTVVNNGLWYVCCPGCNNGVAKSAAVRKELVDVVSSKKFKVSAESPQCEYKGQLYIFANAETKAAFEKEPEKYAVIYAK